MNIDDRDRALLAALQRDAAMPAAELSLLLNLSASQIGRRKQRLEREGYINGYRADVPPDRVGLMVQAFVQVVMATHTQENAQDFVRLTQTTPQIIGAWTLTGDADYLLRIYCPDLSDLNRFVQQVLLPHPAVSRVQSQIVMERIKSDAPLPV